MVTEWCHDNPDVARGLAHVVTQVSGVVNEAARPVGLILSQVTTALNQSQGGMCICRMLGNVPGIW